LFVVEKIPRPVPAKRVLPSKAKTRTVLVNPFDAGVQFVPLLVDRKTPSDRVAAKRLVPFTPSADIDKTELDGSPLFTAVHEPAWSDDL
jgi:hypothetical protein